MTQPLGLFGGTFDPIHWGHIRTAAALREELALPEIRFMVNARPPHRSQPLASPEQRFTMVELALSEQAGLVADRRELDRPGPSYTLWTLRQLRAEYGQRPLLWIIGADALATFNAWFQWPVLLDLSHWVVLPRPGSETALPPAFAQRAVTDAARLTERAAGLVYLAATPEVMISASEIRAALAAGRAVQKYLPAAVLAYIEQHHLYQTSQVAELKRGTHAV